jgi:hypothetical protein
MVTIAMRSIRHISLLLVFVWSAFLGAQELRYIDLASIQQRTDLRFPPQPPTNCEDGTGGVGAAWGGGSMGDGASDMRDPHALGVFLLRVTPTDIDPAEPFEAEFRVQNTGLASIEVPASRHLSDLPPDDESARFSYFSIALVVNGESEPQRPDGASVGFVELCGSADQEGSMLVLKPGEWIRARANVKLHKWPSEPTPAHFRGVFWLRKNTFQPHPGGSSTESQNLYPNEAPTPAFGLPASVRLRTSGQLDGPVFAPF